MVAGVAALALLGVGVRTASTLLPAADLAAVPAGSPSANTATPGSAESNSSEPNPAEPGAATLTPVDKPVETAPKQTDDEPISVPATGPGTYIGAKVAVDSRATVGTVRRFDVRVEKGLDIDAVEAAQLMEEVLDDRRSWRGTGRWRFELVEAGQSADLHAYIATPGTTDRLCAPLLTRGEVSCQNGNRVVLNAKRWVLGAAAYGDDVSNYRRYLINHEFGHALGHQHVQCPGRGERAPVMMQQTKGLGNCLKNPWPLTSGD